MSDENTPQDEATEPVEMSVTFNPPDPSTLVPSGDTTGDDNAVLVSFNTTSDTSTDWDDLPTGEVTLNPDGSIVPVEEAVTEAPAPVDVPAPALADGAAPAAPTTGRTKADLKTEVRVVLDAYVTGTLKDVDDQGNEVPFNKTLTVQRIAKAVQRNRGAGAAAPSSGAVNALLLRWQRYDLVVLSEGPTSFVGYTKTAETDGFKATQAAYREQQKAARAAAKAAAAPAPPAPEPAVAASDAPEVTAPAEQVDPVEAAAPADDGSTPAPFDS